MTHTLRSPKTQKAFEEFHAAHPDAPCPMCAEPEIRRFANWRLMVDRFPYDAIARVHHMLAPIRHVGESELTDEEKRELEELKLALATEYDQFVENAERLRSVHGHYHLHLLVLG